MSLIFRQKLLPFGTGFMVLKNFIEINTFIKKSLNFKCEVKSHNVQLATGLLQNKVSLDYYNNKALSILFKNKAGSKYYTDS